MPNRIIKESIWTSPNFNELSGLAERHFYRILLLPDDFGCCEVTANVVKGRCYPLKPEVSIKMIETWQDEIESCNLIFRWIQCGRTYAIFPTFARHHRVRALHLRKTPDPPQFIVDKCNLLLASDGTCQQVSSSDGLTRAPVNPNPNPNHNHNHNPVKSPYGELNNVFLFSDEYQKLIDRFGEKSTTGRINKLSTYIGSKGDKYKSHYATILNWARDEKPEEDQEDDPGW